MNHVSVSYEDLSLDFDFKFYTRTGNLTGVCSGSLKVLGLVPGIREFE